MTKDSAYAFAVSAVRVRENALLSKNQLETLVTASDESAVLRLLEDYGYKGIAADPEAVLSERLASVTAFINEVSPDKGLLSFLFIGNDFHNLKATMKCSVSDISPDKYFLPAVSITHDAVKTAVADKRFDDLPEILKAPAAEAWQALMVGMNGQLCEMILDRVALSAAVTIAEESGDEFCIGLARLRRRLTALLIAYRCAATGKGVDFIRSALPDMDDPAKDAVVKAALAGCDEVIALAEKCGAALPDNADASDISAAMRALEDEYIAKSAFVSMGIAPLVSYYLRAHREVSRITVILSYKRCGQSDEACRKRVGL